MRERYVSDGDQEIWAVAVEERARSASPRAVLALALGLTLSLAMCCLAGPGGMLLFAVLSIWMSINGDWAAPRAPLRRYRRIRLDPAGLRVDWLDEVEGEPSPDQLCHAQGVRPQRIDWDEMDRLERSESGVIRITSSDGRVRTIPDLSIAESRVLYERLVAVRQGRAAGATAAELAARRRADVERLVGQREP